MKTILYTLLLVFPTLVFGQSSVWKISKGDQQLYLGGTIHVLSKEDYPLPDEFTQAYQQSDSLVFEVNLTEASSPSAQQTMFKRFSYTNGKTLEQALRPATMKKLQDYATDTSMPLQSLLPFTPQLVSLIITMAELQRIGINVTGVDQYFELLANKDGKSLAYLETLDEQMNFIANMGKGREDELILHTIEEAKQIRNLMGELTKSWRSGDIAKLNEIGVAPMQKHFPKIYNDLLVRRNSNWLPQLEKMLSTETVEYVLVGTLHLVGKDGLLKLLEDKGYSVQQL